MNYFNVKKLNNGFSIIEDCSETRMYLIEGETKALLIDTGIGCGDLLGFLKTITSKPITVALSHGHYDHSGGIFNFEEIICSNYDKKLIEEAKNVEIRYKYTLLFLEKYGNKEEISINDFKTKEEIKINNIEDGQIINLGNRQIVAIHLPGHTKGSFGYYDTLSKSFIVSDACNPLTYMFFDESTSIEEYLNTLNKLETFKDKISRFYVSHDYGYIKEEIPLSCIDEVKKCCLDILEGKDDKEIFKRSSLNDRYPLSGYKLNKDYSRSDGKVGNIIYFNEKIYKEKK